MNEKLPVLYVGPECPACHTAKRFLELRGIAYEERSVEDPRVMRELLAITGKTTVPVLDLPTGELLIGWEPRRWARALDPEGAREAWPDGAGRGKLNGTGGRRKT